MAKKNRWRINFVSLGENFTEVLVSTIRCSAPKQAYVAKVQPTEWMRAAGMKECSYTVPAKPGQYEYAAKVALRWYFDGKLGIRVTPGYLTAEYLPCDALGCDLAPGQVASIECGPGTGTAGMIDRWDTDGNVTMVMGGHTATRPSHELRGWTDEEMAEAANPGDQAFGYTPSAGGGK